MTRTAVLTALALAGMTTAALAQSHCIALSIPKGAFAEHGGKWVELTSEQYHFMQGVYVANPSTPPGLPLGDRAIMATTDEAPGALIFFIDGDMACSPMPVPSALIDMMSDVSAGVIRHEGSDN